MSLFIWNNVRSDKKLKHMIYIYHGIMVDSMLKSSCPAPVAHLRQEYSVGIEWCNKLQKFFFSLHFYLFV